MALGNSLCTREGPWKVKPEIGRVELAYDYGQRLGLMAARAATALCCQIPVSLLKREFSLFIAETSYVRQFRATAKSKLSPAEKHALNRQKLQLVIEQRQALERERERIMISHWTFMEPVEISRTIREKQDLILNLGRRIIFFESDQRLIEAYDITYQNTFETVAFQSHCIRQLENILEKGEKVVPAGLLLT